MLVLNTKQKYNVFFEDSYPNHLLYNHTDCGLAAKKRKERSDHIIDLRSISVMQLAPSL